MVSRHTYYAIKYKCFFVMYMCVPNGIMDMINDPKFTTCNHDM